MKKIFTILAFSSVMGSFGAGAQNTCVDTVQYMDDNTVSEDYITLGGTTWGVPTSGGSFGLGAMTQGYMGLHGNLTGVTFDAQSFTGDAIINVAIWEGVETGIWSTVNKPKTRISSVPVTINNTKATYKVALPTAINFNDFNKIIFVTIEAGNLIANNDSVKIFTAGYGEVNGVWFSSHVSLEENPTALGDWFNHFDAYGSQYRGFKIRPIIEYDFTPNFSTNQTDICLGGDIDFTYNNPPSPGNMSSFISPGMLLHPYYNTDVSKTHGWDFGDGSPENNVDVNPTHTFNLGSNSVTLKTYFTRYTGPICITEFVVPINANDPVADFAISDNGNLTVDFTDNSVGAQDYSWDLGDGNTSMIADPSNTYSGNGSYDVKLVITNENGACADSITKSIVLSVGIEEVNHTFNKIFPNPVSESLNLKFNNGLEENSKVEIFDILGNRVYQMDLDKGIQQSTIKVSELSNGKYFISITNSSGVYTKAFVKS